MNVGDERAGRGGLAEHLHHRGDLLRATAALRRGQPEHAELGQSLPQRRAGTRPLGRRRLTPA